MQPSPAVLSACVILCLANAFSGCSSVTWKKDPVIVFTEVLPGALLLGLSPGLVLQHPPGSPANSTTPLLPFIYEQNPASALFLFTSIPHSPHLSLASKFRALSGAQSWGSAAQLSCSSQSSTHGFFSRVLGHAERSPRSTVWEARVPPIARAGII